MHEAMVLWGFTHLACEWCIYYRQDSHGVVMATIHVNDILSVVSSPEENEH